jgi:type IV pilus biogenesis protein CpaD/CtpE
MNRLAVSFTLIAALFFSGCVAVHPVVSALSVTAGVLLDTEAEKPESSISVNQMLAQARNGKTVSISEDVQQLSLSIASDHLNAAQKYRLNNYAIRLSADSIRKVQILAGSAGGLKDAFTSFQRGREIAQILESKGVTARVVMNPKRASGRIEIIPLATKRKNDA